MTTTEEEKDQAVAEGEEEIVEEGDAVEEAAHEPEKLPGSQAIVQKRLIRNKPEASFGIQFIMVQIEPVDTNGS